MYTFYSKQSTKNRNERATFVGDFSEGILKISVARCSKKDQFARHKGRQIAEGRFYKNKFVFTKEMPSCTSKEFVDIAKSLTGEIIHSKVVLMASKPVSVNVEDKQV